MYKIKRFNKISDAVGQYLPQDKYEIAEDFEDYDAVLVRSAALHDVTFPERTLAIARAGAGVNNIPVEKCAERGIVVFNTPGANANAVKELVLCGMLMSGRKIAQSMEWLKGEAAGSDDVANLIEKSKSRFAGPELLGKKLGVIGLGAIGVMVANAAARGLGMEVMGYDPYLSVDSAWHLDRRIERAATIEQILASCDYVTLHLPLSDATRNTIDAAAIAKMKNGAVLLNFARGGLVDTDAVLDAVAGGHLAKYVTDFPDSRLIGKENIICTPHLGASTPESEENCAIMAARELADYIENGNIRNSVNFPNCELPREGGVRLAIINKNVPNILGQLTALLAAEGLNIEHMINKSRGEWAYTMFDLTREPQADCLNDIKAVEGIVRVRVIK